MTRNPICGRWDHPREYGENGFPRFFGDGEAGSSPRIRGEFVGDDGETHALRIIPANTGRMRSSHEKKQDPRDHPREYGENSSLVLVPSLLRGSSPRIRGESHVHFPWIINRGIIPANTGRMCTHITPAVAEWDHPREYGENSFLCPRTTASLGSSPRIRGEYLLT